MYLAFEENASGGYSVRGMGFDDSTVVLPEYYEAEDGDKPITEISQNAFFDITHLSSIVLPDSVTTIGSTAPSAARK